MPLLKLRAPAIVATILCFVATSATAAGAEPADETAGSARDAGESAITPPKALDTAFGYPAGATGDATVVVELTVEADGTVSGAKAVSGAEPFATAASRAAQAWKFEPARRAARAIRTRIRVEVNFVGEHLLTSPAPPKAPPPAPPPAASGGAAPSSSQYVVTVRGDRAAPGGVSVARAEARLLPGTFGDPFRAIEAQPGVTPVVSAIPFFFIRGAPPGNVGFLIDGVRVPLLFHALLGPAVLQPAFIDRIDVYKGGYPARYGRFAGGIVAAETVPPADTLHAQGQLRLIDASGVVSTPFADGSGHVMVGGRYAFAGLILAPLTNAVLEYWDYQLLANYDLSEKDTLGIFAFGALDYIGDDTGQNFGGTQFHRIDLREDHVFGIGTKLRTAVTAGYDRSLAIGGTVSDKSLAGRLTLEHRLGETATMRTGADASLDAYALDLHDPDLVFRDATLLFPARTELVSGAYVDFELHPEPWFTLTPGIRSDLFHSEGMTKVGVDPRVGASFEVSRNVKLVHAFGIAHQSPNYVPNLPGAQVGGLKGGLQRSVQYSAGVETLLPEDISASLTLFEHDYFNLSDPLGFSRSIAFNADNADVRATGYAYGAELSVRRSLTRRLGGLLSYTLSRSVRSREDLNSLSAFDRTHVANVALGYDLGRRWRIGARALYASGVPTRTLTGSGPKFGGERAPPLFRLDLRVEKRWRLGAHGYWGVTAEVINATAGTEVTGRQCSVVKCTQSAVGPLVLPSLGVEAGF
ncbi:MAG TPA: TonB family protein [Polyangiaceae bacterium]